ncbi:MAG: AzlC family ABC transporter permease [Pseudochelatococcus sp.]|jgi:4-azaleucine resistance transporter AzlC|uniref:AzlC family ABC transporter permease n=1 Tax=Pseudochelatococcus sp. TaxID=2020869 RepID=UPI003D931058
MNIHAGKPPVAAPATTAREIRRGLADIAPVLVAMVPIGVLFGAICATKGWTSSEVWLMSTFVFSGGAEFAAIGIWSVPVPYLALIVSTCLVSARHILMGVSLAPKMGAFSGWKRWAAAWFMTDEAWALGEKRARTGTITVAYWFAMAAPVHVVWVASTITGSIVGPALGKPEAVGLDFAFTALFIGLIAGFWQGRRTVWTLVASGGASALVAMAVGEPWNVLAGAAAGIVAAWFATPPDADDAPEKEPGEEP